MSDLMWRAVHKGGVRAIVTMPPRHGKSQLVSRWSSTYALDVDPTSEIMLCAYGADLAEGWSRQIREDLASPEIRASVNPRDAASRSWRTTAGGGVVAVGVNGSITGKGADIAIIDDPIKNRLEADSDTYRRRVWDWYQSTLLTRLSPNGSIIVCLTRWHHDDLAGRLLEADRKGDGEGWEVIDIPAVSLGEGDALGRPEGEGLWLERFGQGWYEKRRRALKNGREWWALYQQQPQVEGGSFYPNPLPYYRERPKGKEFAAILVSIDTKLKGGKGTDPMSAGIFGLERKLGGSDRLYLLDEEHSVDGFRKCCQRLKVRLEMWPRPKAVIVEDKALGDALAEFLREMNLANRVIQWNPGPHGSKEARAMAGAMQVEDGKCVFPSVADAPWMHDFAREVSQFPVGAHDDRVDMLSQILIWAFVEGRLKTIGVKMSNRLAGASKVRTTTS